MFIQIVAKEKIGPKRLPPLGPLASERSSKHLFLLSLLSWQTPVLVNTEPFSLYWAISTDEDGQGSVFQLRKEICNRLELRRSRTGRMEAVELIRIIPEETHISVPGAP